MRKSSIAAVLAASAALVAATATAADAVTVTYTNWDNMPRATAAAHLNGLSNSDTVVTGLSASKGPKNLFVTATFSRLRTATATVKGIPWTAADTLQILVQGAPKDVNGGTVEMGYKSTNASWYSVEGAGVTVTSARSTAGAYTVHVTIPWAKVAGASGKTVTVSAYGLTSVAKNHEKGGFGSFSNYRQVTIKHK